MSPCSMTGYARVQGHDDTLSWVWEIKTVNARGLEIRTRLPAGFDALDLPAREAVQKRLKRGSVNVSLAVTRRAAPAGYTVNEALLARYADVARSLSADPVAGVFPPSADGLLALKGVIEAAEADEVGSGDETERTRLMAGFDEALEAVLAMRRAEGERLTTVLGGQLEQIAALVGEAEGTAELDPAAVAERLRQQVAALIDAVPSLSEDRLMQEVALIAAKADVREELDRLRAHLAAARDMLAGADAVGRRLDFLCQEFNREANTLCSKANAVALTRIGMNLKAVIEQFREQVQNVE